MLARYLTAFALMGLAVMAQDIDGDGLPDPWEDQLAATFSPVVMLHPHERFFPELVDRFVNASTLLYDHGEEYHPCVVDKTPRASFMHRYIHHSDLYCVWPGQPSVECVHGGPLCNATDFGFAEARKHPECLTGDTSHFYLQVDDVHVYQGSKPSIVPVYAHVSPAVNNAHTGYISVQYWFFYAFNGPIDGWFGQHEGDWEHISLIIDNSTLEVQEAYFAAHSHESLWMNKSEVTFIDKTHPVVYSALHSHASYPSPGVKHRKVAAGLASDYCKGGGAVWHPEPVNVGERGKPMPGASWLLFNGKWGSPTGAAVRPSLLSGSPPAGPAMQYDYWHLN